MLQRIVQSVWIKIAILLLGISIIPLTIASVLIIQQTTKSLEEQVRKTQVTTAQINSRFIDNWIYDKITTIENTINEYEAFQSGELDEILPLLQVMNHADDDIESYAYVDVNGLAFDTLGRESNISALDHFQYTKKNKKVFISDIMEDIHTREKILNIYVPILNNNELSGIILAMIDPKQIVEMINSIELSHEGFGYLVDQHGTILAHPNEELIGDKVASSVPEMDRFKEAILNHDAGYITYEDHLVAYEKLNKVHWHLVITTPENNIYAQMNATKDFTMMIVLASIIVVGLITFFAMKFIRKETEDVIHIMDDASNGDFRKRLTSKGNDEIAQLKTNINHMLDSFTTMIQQVLHSSEEVVKAANKLKQFSAELTTSSTQISESTNTVIQGAQNQFEASQQTSAATEEMAAGVQRIADNTVQVSELSSTVAQDVTQGSKEVTNAISHMNSTSESVHQTVAVMQQLQEKSEAVHRIVDIISHVADETNLLALNATIEAARAGEYGRGFAVVASEVKKLADQTTEATNEITAILEDIITSTNETTKLMENSLEQVNEGVHQVQEIDASFQAILQSFEKVNAEIQEISAVSEQIAAGTEQVSASAQEVVRTNELSLNELNEISTHIKEQVQSLKEMKHSSDALHEMASHLQSLIEEFKI